METEGKKARPGELGLMAKLQRRNTVNNAIIDDPTSSQDETLTEKTDLAHQRFLMSLLSAPTGNSPTKQNELRSSSPSSKTAGAEVKKAIAKLLPFVPGHIVGIIGSKTIQSSSNLTHATVMLADISGFTKLSGELCEKGPAGVDELSSIISQFFGKLIDIVESYDGDIVNFAGDALLIGWPTKSFSEQDPLDVDTEQVQNEIMKAYSCALELAELEDFGLTVHIGVSTGVVSYLVLGGYDDYWCSFMVGEPIIRMGDAESHASSKEVVVTLESFKWVHAFCVGDPIEEDVSCRSTVVGNPKRKSGLVLLSSIRMEEVKSKLYLRIGSVLRNQGSPQNSGMTGLRKTSPDSLGSRQKSSFKSDPGTITNRLNSTTSYSSHATDDDKAFATNLASFLPRPALMVLQGNELFLNEYRKRIVVLFVMLEGFKVDIYNENLDHEAVRAALQTALYEFQKILHEHQGMMRQFIVDDKGCVLIVCFGLRDYIHRDDPVRAVLTAIALVKSAEEMGLNLYIGITSGEAYCGAVGSSKRREYAMVGRTVNLAARLMVHSCKYAQGSSSGIICSEPIFKEAKGEDGIMFTPLEPAKLKGIAELVKLYKATSNTGANSNFDRIESAVIPIREMDVVGLETEVQLFRQALRNFVHVDLVNNKENGQGHQHIYIIQGPQGIGKTTLAKLVRSMADTECFCTTIFARGFASQRNTPYFVMRKVFRCLLDLDQDGGRRGRYQDPSSIKKNSSENDLDDFEQHERRLIESIMARVCKAKFPTFEIGQKSSLSESILSHDSKSLRESETGDEAGINTGRSKQAKDQNDQQRLGGGTHSVVVRRRRSSISQHFMRTRSSSVEYSDRSSMNEAVALETNKRAGTHGHGSLGQFVDKALFPVTKYIFQLSWQLGGTGRNKIEFDFTPGNESRELLLLIWGILVKEKTKKAEQVAIFVEDMHLLDSLSLRFLRDVAGENRGDVFLVITNNPDQESSLPEWQELKAMRDVSILNLQPLSRENVENLVRKILRNSEIPTQTLDYVWEYGKGVPLTSKEIAHGLLHLDSDKESEGNYSSMSQRNEGKLSEDVLEAAIQSRLDRLAGEYQAILKTASVIGNVFTLDHLERMLPRYITRKNDVRFLLNELCKMDWVMIIHDDDIDPTYMFLHDILKHVLYNLNTVSAQKKMHAACSHYIEKTYDDDLRPYFSVLAYHYRKAEQHRMALRFYTYLIRMLMNFGAAPEVLRVARSVVELDLDVENLRDFRNKVVAEGNAIESGINANFDLFSPKFPNPGSLAPEGSYALTQSSDSFSSTTTVENLKTSEIVKRILEMVDGKIALVEKQNKSQKAHGEGSTESAPNSGRKTRKSIHSSFCSIT